MRDSRLEIPRHRRDFFEKHRPRPRHRFFENLHIVRPLDV